MKCSMTYRMNLFEMSLSALRSLEIDIKAQLNSGLMTQSEAQDRLNIISAVILSRQNEGLGDSEVCEAV